MFRNGFKPMTGHDNAVSEKEAKQENEEAAVGKVEVAAR